jgi:hypothetical protein
VRRIERAPLRCAAAPRRNLSEFSFSQRILFSARKYWTGEYSAAREDSESAAFAAIQIPGGSLSVRVLTAARTFAAAQGV